MSKKGKGERECGYCHGKGHNTRTCEKKKLDEASGAIAPTAATAAPTTAPTGGGILREVPMLADYEQLSRVREVGRNKVSFIIRETTQGSVALVLRLESPDPTDETAPPKVRDFNFPDVETAGAAYELLHWGLGKQAVRQKEAKLLAARMAANGKAIRSAATPAVELQPAAG